MAKAAARKSRPAGKQAAAKLGVIGAGKLGGILIEAFQRRQAELPLDISATVQHAERAVALSRQFGVPVGIDNQRLARASDIILVCVKPQSVGEVLQGIHAQAGRDKLIISTVAAATTAYLEDQLAAPVPVVRTMPNTPAFVGCGMTALCAGRYATAEHVETARALFAAVGRTVIVDERQMDAITGLSASGPAYIYIILESLAEAGVKVGLPRELATQLAAQTTLGAAQVVLNTGHHPALLKDQVTTPAGCTIDGILELEEGKLRVTLIKAVVKATQRAHELLLT